MTTHLTVDQLLSRQQDTRLLATVEAIDDKPDLVKVTPWLADRGCLCSISIALPREAIVSVSLTNETHLCCGKTLDVVEITFAADAQLSITDVFRQITMSGSRVTSRMDAMEGFPFSFQGVNLPFPINPSDQNAKMNSDRFMSLRMMRRSCVPVCMCWPDGCLCYWDCTNPA